MESQIKKDQVISDKDYFAYPALSKSQIREWDNDYPQGFWRNCAFNPDKVEKKMTGPIATGSATHTMVFEPEKIVTEFIATDDFGISAEFRKNKKYEEAEKAYPDKRIINLKELRKAEAMAIELRKHPLIPSYLKFGKAEQPYVWFDKEHRIWCKAKLDWIRGGDFKDAGKGIVIFDYKTTGTFQTMIRNAYTNKCFVDAGFYERMAKHKFGDVPVKVIFIIQSTKQDEFDKIAIRSLDEYSMNFARDAVSEIMHKIKNRLVSWKKGDPNAWLPRYEERNWEIPPFAYDNHFGNEEVI